MPTSVVQCPVLQNGRERRIIHDLYEGVLRDESQVKSEVYKRGERKIMMTKRRDKIKYGSKGRILIETSSNRFVCKIFAKQNTFKDSPQLFLKKKLKYFLIALYNNEKSLYLCHAFLSKSF